jgi:hypothetical protein
VVQNWKSRPRCLRGESGRPFGPSHMWYMLSTLGPAAVACVEYEATPAAQATTAISAAAAKARRLRASPARRTTTVGGEVYIPIQNSNVLVFFFFCDPNNTRRFED